MAARRIRIVAISADEVEDLAALQTKLPAITLLTDLGLVGLRAWGVVIKDAEHPSPATFVVGEDGLVTYRRLLDADNDWPSYGELVRSL
ncbi:MAG: redoxin domain-containing protein [Deltaproteobacteria bacterium]|nr:redoxin domain-containing protein [Deltaproteobacteria bacterium]